MCFLAVFLVLFLGYLLRGGGGRSPRGVSPRRAPPARGAVGVLAGADPAVPWACASAPLPAGPSLWVRDLGEGVRTLRDETGNLVSALKRPSTRGAWGEIQLRNAVEMAGMVSHCDFLEQATLRSADGALRPDMLVRLPGGKIVVVDAK